MRLLILGGTVFLGRHLSALALDGGHRLTLFNRGRHNPDLFPHAQSLRGDRDDDLRALAQGEWDAVIDTSGYVPRIVRKSARMLSERAGLYVFISSISVYAGAGAFRADEDAPLAAPCASTSEEVDARTYGPFKAQCEAVVTRETNGRCLIIRPGLIVGPHDPSDRFTYWPRRLSGGGEILAPGIPQRRERQARHARFGGLEHPEIERLHDHPILHPVPVDDLQQHFGVALGRRREMGMGGEALHLDIH